MPKTVLNSEVTAIRRAVEAVAHPSTEIVAISDEHRRLETLLKEHRDSPEAVVAAYNKARRRLMVEAALSRGLGWCSTGRHFVALDDLEGVITVGAYVTSGYYEHLKPFESRGTTCGGCRSKLRSDSGRYDGEHSNSHIYELRDAAVSLDRSSDDWQMERQAVDHLDLGLPPRAIVDTYGKVKIGDQTIEASRD